MRHMASMAGKFNLIFLDPPYQLQLLPQLLPLCRRLLEQDGLVYIENDQPFDSEFRPDWLKGWKIIRASKAGVVNYGLLALDDLIPN